MEVITEELDVVSMRNAIKEIFKARNFMQPRRYE